MAGVSLSEGSVGNVSGRLNRLLTVGAIAGAISFQINGCIESGPGDWKGFTTLSAFRISSAVKPAKDKDDKHFYSCGHTGYSEEWTGECHTAQSSAFLIFLSARAARNYSTGAIAFALENLGLHANGSLGVVAEVPKVMSIDRFFDFMKLNAFLETSQFSHTWLRLWKFPCTQFYQQMRLSINPFR